MRDSFLRSKEWKELREKALVRDGQCCFLCGSLEKLCVHHIRYRKFAKKLQNKLWNLITLCKSCHFKIHKSSANIDLTLKLQKYRPEQLKKIS